jgi:uroporphyrinogen-III synthase
MPVMPNVEAAAPRVALFRAREDAAGSAARLRRLGFAVACLPVVEVAPLEFAPKRRRYDAVIATSAKAFLKDAPVGRDSPLYVVGAATARASARRGWRLASAPAPNSARLIEVLKRALPPGAAVLYLAGRDRKQAIEAALGGAQSLEVVEVYAAEARRRWRPAEVRALNACRIALHYSSRSAALATALAEGAGAGARFRLMTHVCLSDDAAARLEAFGAHAVRTAASPEEEALFATLIEAAAVFPSLGPSRI